MRSDLRCTSLLSSKVNREPNTCLPDLWGFGSLAITLFNLLVVFTLTEPGHAFGTRFPITGKLFGRLGPHVLAATPLNTGANTIGAGFAYIKFEGS